jgi:hypothetical protein
VAGAGRKDGRPRTGGRSRRVPMRQLRVTGIGRPMPARRLTARHLAKTPKRWGGAEPDKPKGTAPEKSAHRGFCGGRLRTPRAGRRDTGLDSRLYPDFGKPRCREAPGSTGPSGPGVPRALGLRGAPLRITARPRRKKQGRRGVGFTVVIAGLGPAIPMRDTRLCLPKRDARDKRGHDE